MELTGYCDGTEKVSGAATLQAVCHLPLCIEQLWAVCARYRFASFASFASFAVRIEHL